MNSEFKQYRRTQIAEIRPVTKNDIQYFKKAALAVSISEEDLKNGSPKIGDMIGRNPKNYMDQWLIAEQYFKDNFETMESNNIIEVDDTIIYCLNCDHLPSGNLCMGCDDDYSNFCHLPKTK